jgi:hypothetical protein
VLNEESSGRADRVVAVVGRGGRGSVWRQDRDGQPKEDKNDRDGAGRTRQDKGRATRWRQGRRKGQGIEEEMMKTRWRTYCRCWKAKARSLISCESQGERKSGDVRCGTYG